MIHQNRRRFIGFIAAMTLCGLVSSSTVPTGMAMTPSSGKYLNSNASDTTPGTKSTTPGDVATGKAVHFPGNDGQSHKVTWDAESFKVDGQRLNIYSGEFHYWRLPSPNEWRDILQKMKADGYNAVSFYFFWGLHSTQPGVFDFTGIKDIDLLLRMASEEGLYVIARPGPYVNAEISMGGLPAYMTNFAPGLRSTSPVVLKESKSWLRAVNAIIKKHQVTDGGGSVIMYQAENELLGEDRDRPEFLKSIVDEVKADGITVPVFHNDFNLGGRFAPGKPGPAGATGTEFYAYDHYPLGFNCSAGRNQISDTETQFRSFTASHPSPNFITEAQGGAFTPWGANFQSSKCAEFVDANFIRQFGVNNMANGVTAFNYYMLFGGTNWGWTGSPSSGFTSYDYGAALDENRQMTPKFAAQKQLGYLQKSLPQLASMIAQPAPETTVTGAEGQVKGYQRIATGDIATSSVTGNGARLLAFRQPDSNATGTVAYTTALTLAKAVDVTPVEYTADDTDSAKITYAGAWEHATGKPWTAADYKGTETFSNTAGDSASFTFTGEGVKWVAPQSSNHGYAEVYIDGKLEQTVTTFARQNAASQFVAFQKSGLDPAVSHTIKIVVKGTQPTGSEGAYVSIDAFDVITSGAPSPSPGTDGAVTFPRVPQKAGTSLVLHGRDAQMVVADARIGGLNLLYSTSELFGTQPTTAGGTFVALSGVRGDAGETVLKFASKPTVTTLEGMPVEVAWDEATGQLRLNYLHGDRALVQIADGSGAPALLQIGSRDEAATTWWLHGVDVADAAASPSVFATGADLVRRVQKDGSTLNLWGDSSGARVVKVFAPAGVDTVTWNGQTRTATVDAQGRLVFNTDAPPQVTMPALDSWVKHTDGLETAADYNDADWTVANKTTTLNPQQGPGPVQKVVLDSNAYQYYEGDVWYRAHYTASATVPTSIALQGQGGTASNMLVWINGQYAGANAADGTSHAFAVPAGAVQAGKPVVVSVLLRNQGQNLDWSDNGLSQQNRGLYDATLGNQGPVTWKIRGGFNQANPSDTQRTMYNTGGLTGELEGWHLPSYPDQSWAAATNLKPDAPGVTWYRTKFDLAIPTGVDTAVALKVHDAAFETGRSDMARAVFYVNGWNIGTFVGNVGPQSVFTIPSGFLNRTGTNTLSVAVTSEQAGMGPESLSLVNAGTTLGGVPWAQNSARDFEG